MSYSKKTIWIMIGLSILLGGIWLFMYKNKQQQEIMLGACRFNIEIPKTNEEMALGLGGRNSLCQRCGMFFKFSEKKRYKFWMKEMHFPIDIVWLVDDRVVGIENDISNESGDILQPSEAINNVLEINSNEVDRCNIEVGDIIKRR